MANTDKRRIEDTAFYFFITTAKPNNADAYLKENLKDYGHHKVNPFLGVGVPNIPEARAGQALALKVAKMLTGDIFDLNSESLIREICVLTDNEGEKCILLRIYDPNKIQKTDLPENYEWKSYDSKKGGSIMDLLSSLFSKKKKPSHSKEQIDSTEKDYWIVMNESMKLSGFSIAPIILEVIASYSPKTGKSYENTYMITAFSNDRKAKAFYENWGVKSGNIVGNNYKVIKTSKRDLKAVSIHLKEKAKMTGEKMAIMLDVEWDGQVSGCDDILKPEEL